ncbi:urea transporter [Rhodoligotrophos defluvii]|uniref:urea transporter n=1 Tax=Rhodoligotrophos defluvii TaxID=2561934 RepID=UPI0010C9DA1E|nr:urea transporter [Rhodoligotrophos defluvii]
MTGLVDRWSDVVGRSRALWLLDIHLRGAGQVMLQNNPLTGLLFILGICWGAIAAGNLALAIGGVVGLIVATLTAILLEADETALDQGLFGFNGILVGVAIPTFLAMSPATWFILIIGAAVSTIVMLATSHVMKVWGVPALTFPFVLTAWLVVLAAYSFGHLSIRGLAPPSLPTPIGETAASLDLSAGFFLTASIKGISQVFLINNIITGAMFILALLVSSGWAAGFAILGSIVSVAVALALGSSPAAIDAGLYSFSPVLTAIALGCVFFKPSSRVALFALLGTVFAVIVQAAFDAALAPLGVPTFTIAFVLVTWLFLLPKLDLKPHRHEPLEDGIVTDR